MSRRTQLVILAVVLAAAAGLAIALARTGGDEASTIRVQREDFEVVIEAPGKLEAAVAFEIGPPSVRDYWEHNLEWMIPEGQVVAAGDVIARFDSTQLDDRLRDHRAKLETVQQEKEKEQRNLQVSLKQLRLDLVKARGELKVVALDLSVPENLVAGIELEQARLKKSLAEQRLAFLEEKIEFEQELVTSKLELLDVKRRYEEGKIAYNEATMEKFNVRAPVAGLIVYIPKQNGDRWEVGEGVWMLAKIMKVADVSTLQVEANVPEVDAARIAPGQTAQVSVDAIPGMVLQSEISEIGRIVHERSAQDASKVFDAILPLDQIDTDVLRPGMGVTVNIQVDLLPDRLTIPIESIRASEEGTFVEVLGTGGRVERRIVTLGARSGDRVEVVEGLVENETVRLGEDRT